jgi:hypothetical protein
MKDIRQRAQELIDKYEARLAACGIKIEITKRYFETNVCEESSYYRVGESNIFNIIFEHIERENNRKREKKKGYNYQKNQYHCLVLAVIPTEKKILKREFCKEYAFVLRKVERAYIGEKPKKSVYEENKVLAKIEKRILKTINKAKKTTAQKVCKDTLWDVLRYVYSNKYEYKSRFCGKYKFFWDIAAAGVIFIMLILLNAILTAI